VTGCSKPISRKLLKTILEHKEVCPLLSDEHFTVDGTLVTAWASLKSSVPKEGATAVDTPPDDGQRKPPAVGAQPEDEAASKAEKKEQAAQPTSADPGKPESAAPVQTAAEAYKRSRNEEVDYHGQKRCNDTHISTTDPEARLFRKGPARRRGCHSWGTP
jgi:hypothetical protein